MSEDILNHLKTVFKNATAGYISITRLGDKPRQAWHHVVNVEAAAKEIAELSLEGNTYYGNCLHLAPQPEGRGDVSTVSIMNGFYLDLDFATEGDDSLYRCGEDAKNPPVRPSEVVAFLKEIGLPTPSLLVGTGNGLHGHFLFETPFEIKTDDDRRRAQALWVGVEAHVRMAAKERGWSIDRISDLARITRAAGTQNFGKRNKPHAPKPVVALEGGSGIRYAFSDLERFAAPEGGVAVKTGKRPALQEETNPANFDAIYAGCDFMRHFKDDAAKLSEPEWYAGTSITAHCNNGRELTHELSKPYGSYSEVETDFYIGHAMQYPPRTCADIQERFAHPGCRDCPFRKAGVRSPIKLGYSDPALVQLQRDYVYEAQRKLFINRETLTELDKDSFNGLYAHQIKNPAATFISSEISPRVLKSEFLPGQPRVIGQGLDGVFNTFTPSEVLAEPGECTSILSHIEYLFPDPEERGHLLDWFAFLLQHPEAKLGTALLIIGEAHGTGKTEVLRLIRRLIGWKNTVETDNDELKSDFNARFQNKSLVVVEELMTDHRMESYNRIKTLITGEDARANEKNVKRVEARSANAFAFVSNHLRPIFLEHSDRRFLVLRTVAQPKDADHYRWLFAERFPAEQRAFKRFLLERDLSAFNPKAQPPMTAAKRDLVEWSAPPILRAIREALEARLGCFSKDIGSQREVIETLIGAGAEVGGGPNAMHDALLAIGAQKLPVLRNGSNGTLNVWAWRNTDYWQRALPEERRRHIAGESNLKLVA